MAQTLAERQATYRKNRLSARESGERRLNTWITTATAVALKRLVKRYGVTQREMLAQLIRTEDERLIESLESDSVEWNIYFDIK